MVVKLWCLEETIAFPKLFKIPIKKRESTEAYTTTSVNQDKQCSISKSGHLRFANELEAFSRGAWNSRRGLLQRNILFPERRGVLPARNRMIARTYRNTSAIRNYYGRCDITSVLYRRAPFSLAELVRPSGGLRSRARVNVSMYNMRADPARYLDVVAMRASELSGTRIRYLEHRRTKSVNCQIGNPGGLLPDEI